MKDINKAIESDFDFGFSSVDSIPDPTKSKAERMYKMILPLLNNLAKDADTREYIHWPDRSDKIQKFHDKLEALLNE